MTTNSNQKVPTQQSVKAYVDAVEAAILAALYPVGSIYISGSDTMPAKIDDLGTWARIEGRMIVGASDTDGDFDNGDTDGVKEVTLTEAQMPSHTHVQDAHNHTNGAYDRLLKSTNTETTSDTDNTTGEPNLKSSATIASATANNQNTGGGEAHSVMNPYKAKYMWERTA